MNYRHAFHAGNFADVHKHAVLARILLHFRQKPGAFRVIDSHAGAGLYDLAGAEAERSDEWRGGIGRLWDEARQGRLDGRVGALLEPYLDAVAGCNPDGGLRIYPGSPLVTRHLLRSQDRLIACELEPHAAAALATALRGSRNAKTLALDGWTAVRAYVPPRERRGLVLVDPPFEDAGDFMHVSSAVAAAYRKWPGGTYLAWYPIKAREAPDALARRLESTAMTKILRSEIMLGRPRGGVGLVGSGLIVVNPPFTLAADLQLLLPTLGRIFGAQATHRLDWLVPER